MEFDATLKEFFQRRPTSLLLELTGGVRVVEFLNVELPFVQERRLDPVLLLEDETLLHVELQSSNDKDIGLRMLEYYALLWRRYRKPLRQVVIYRMRMPRTLHIAALRFSFTLRDIREWRADDLLASPIFGDQVLAILGGTDDARAVVRGVLERIERMVPERRERALRYVLNLAGLRRFGIVLRSTGHSIRRCGKSKSRPTEGVAQGIRDALLIVLEKRFPFGRKSGLRMPPSDRRWHGWSKPATGMS